jgi:hypothetical protein
MDSESRIEEIGINAALIAISLIEQVADWLTTSPDEMSEASTYASHFFGASVGFSVGFTVGSVTSSQPAGLV